MVVILYAHYKGWDLAPKSLWFKNMLLSDKEKENPYFSFQQ